ncbi:MAG: Two component transcriptional regulator, winged helix family [Candidatus Woesebacteria bacterium GW2011_GWC1_38_13]|uniref:Two component transcriptional regulator, winged helix family n=3 Tax=Candidatus Woeseibacteriota TaxID=1752722 RepID=A0A0G0KZG5_9BACT|nr:MAG: Two component transcriptional regulator, winged helix family [Candidatus Woesebacteria bacterium GW2011_GWD1_38_10]KKQ57043.1 MAG: Two component transcriptional regulator, winged helix family [Candidatus Woesebacteria bacterium GW2011_GWC1_38_13]KKQ76326.1 MAG: Two component transcriptional regulator, winged helix family [Microgenomates group bacterium GW2011_GWF1_38_5]KKQ84102.1 MAG: Two component transcriptional regulator, winged helix family [Candidatus Woesebacteria bacterium GW2011_
MYKILVAEDDKLLANAYKVKLAREGYDVLIAADGNEVISTIDNFVPDLIVLDLIMPKTDGFLVLEHLKKSDKWKNVPVLVSSNLSQSEDIVRATKLGADDYIVKSDLSMKVLGDKIKALLLKKGTPKP